ncbi:hypothetical protein KP79_PYT23048 [Mizuhopecten yessoensis]|uniref:Uncharacterized protein n=1 Tax=Mizuhopecten yessoensis TaxID=6573 RepID=A0A210PHA1_MIZYE|nr:hypothetical protein KP79_PYT23048 [Mizuhopecten yessoensis]
MDSRASKALIEETFKIMQHDEVSKVAKSDPLIITLGNNWMLRNVGNKLMRCYYTSSVMRLAAKFKLELQKIDGGDKDLAQLLSPKSFDNTVLAALKCCNQDDEEDLKSPTNAIKLGYDIKRMASAKLATALKEGDETVRKDAEGFLKLMDMEWN